MIYNRYVCCIRRFKIDFTQKQRYLSRTVTIGAPFFEQNLKSTSNKEIVAVFYFNLFPIHHKICLRVKYFIYNPLVNFILPLLFSKLWQLPTPSRENKNTYFVLLIILSNRWICIKLYSIIHHHSNISKLPQAILCRERHCNMQVLLNSYWIYLFRVFLSK